MASIYVSTDMTLEQVFTTTAYVAGDSIYIISGAVITCNQTPTNLLSFLYISDGRFIIDGENIISGNSINFVGSGGHASYDAQLRTMGTGELVVRGAWYSVGTTDGTDSQTVDIGSAGADYWDGDQHIGWIPMIQVETGRRIPYDNASGVDPAVGDWVYKTSDRSVMGKIHSVGVDYIVVWYLTGTLADDEDIVIRSIVDNSGPDLQRSWTATVNNLAGDIKEVGVYHEFGNCVSGSASHISAFHHGVGGFVFENEWQSSILTFGSAAGTTGGFRPPTGCDIRVPNVMFGSAGQTDYDLGLLTNTGSSVESDWYQLEFSGGGLVDLSICNFGNMYTYDTAAYAFNAEYVGASLNLGSSGSGSRTTFDHCVIVQDIVNDANSLTTAFGCFDNVNGSDITFCQLISSRMCRQNIGVSTSGVSNVSDCIVSLAGSGTNLTPSGVYSYFFDRSHDVTFNNNVTIGCDSSAIAASFTSVTTCNNFNSAMNLISATQDETEQTQEKNFMNVTASQNFYLAGLEFLGAGTIGNWILHLYDCTGAKFRGMGMIDDKVDFGVDGEQIIAVTGLCQDIDVARVWKKGGQITSIHNFNSTVGDAIFTNCSGDYSSVWDPGGADNIRYKGVHGGSGNPGGTTGIEDIYNSKYGNNIHDGMRSDTIGFVACVMIAPSINYDETTVIAGRPVFDRAGDLDMGVGDIVEFEQGYFMKGHTGFPGTFTSCTTTSAWNADEWTNTDMYFQYQLEGGSWSGAWLDVRTPANLTGITGAIEEGIKFKFRLEATGTQGSMSMLVIDTNTSLAIQTANFYPIDQVDTIVTLTGLVVGSNVALLDSAGTILYENTTVAVTEHAFTVNDYISVPSAGYTIKVRKAGYEPIKIEATIEGEYELPISQVEAVDITGLAIYNRGDDSTTSLLSIDYANKRVDIGDGIATAEDLFDYVSEQSITDDAMATDVIMRFDGRDVLLLNDWLLRRALAGDTNSGIDANVTVDGDILASPDDEVNGSVDIRARAVRNADGGGGITEEDFHTYLDTYSNKGEFAADALTLPQFIALKDE